LLEIEPSRLSALAGKAPPRRHLEHNLQIWITFGLEKKYSIAMASFMRTADLDSQGLP
jgi:hypothetical protein